MEMNLGRWMARLPGEALKLTDHAEHTCVSPGYAPGGECFASLHVPSGMERYGKVRYMVDGLLHLD